MSRKIKQKSKMRNTMTTTSSHHGVVGDPEELGAFDVEVDEKLMFVFE